MLTESGAPKVKFAAVAVPVVLLIVMVPEMPAPSAKFPFTLKSIVAAFEEQIDNAAKLHNISDRSASFIEFVYLLNIISTGRLFC
jgi:hypothetical protein